MGRLLRHIAKEVFKRHEARRATEDVVANLAFDVDHQFIENFEGFDFIFDQRIALAMTSQIDAVAEAIHFV